MPIADTLPYNDPGSLFGGNRRQIADILGIQADTFRSASQGQNVTQNGRAFSGAQVTNDLSQSETLNQTATTDNTKDIVINPADAAPSDVPAGFNFNFLERSLTQVNARDFLSRSNLVLAQSQRGNQSGFSSGVDFQGNPSVVTNNLDQEETTNQTATSTVNFNIRNLRDPDVENAARFRETGVVVEGSVTEVGSVASQDQGSLDDLPVQSARSDGGITNNNLNQRLNGTQTNNSIQNNTIDVRLDGTEDVLSPRSTNTTVRIENDVVRNFGSASQTQGLLQIAEGGVDEFGNPTENGGQSHNVSSQTANFAENSTAANTLNVLA